MNAEVVGWVQKAEGDYQSARILLRQRTVVLPDNVCWNCQQSAEKYMKAWLVFSGVAYPRQHDLVQLRNLCDTTDPEFAGITGPIATLDQFGTDIRYPGVSANVEEARAAFEALRAVRSLVRAKLGLR